MIDSQHSSHALAMLPFFAPPLFTCRLCPCIISHYMHARNYAYAQLAVTVCSSIGLASYKLCPINTMYEREF